MNHPGVERVETALRAAGVSGEVRWLDDSAKTAAEAAAALGIDVGAIANSLVFTIDGAPLLVMTSGSHRVDTAWLGDQLGGTIKRADADLVKQATGQTIGGIAPIGHPEPLRTIVDAQLAAYPQLWAAAGHAHTVFPLSFDELVRITNGDIRAVTP
jgi:prolyl-tRNA editing enzyme YbaK/EbsC (Cys-tRNA(Pro) deacylase)